MRPKVYAYGVDYNQQAHGMYALLQQHGFSPSWGLKDERFIYITLPNSQVPRFRQLQKAQPEVFGIC